MRQKFDLKEENMKKTVKLGVVGLGRGLVAKSLIKRKDVILSAICDKRQDRLDSANKIIAEEIKKCGRRYSFKSFLSFDEMLNYDSSNKAIGF